jgi:hypothetical protein
MADFHAQTIDISNMINNDLLLGQQDDGADVTRPDVSQRRSYSSDITAGRSNLSPFDLGMAEMRALFTNHLTSGSAHDPGSVSEDGESNSGLQNKFLSSYLANSRRWTEQMDYTLAPTFSDQSHRTKSVSKLTATTASVVSEVESIGNTIPFSWTVGAPADMLENIQDQTWIDALCPNHDLESPKDNVFDLLGSFGMPGTGSTPGSYQDATRNGIAPTFSPVFWKPPLPFGNNVPSAPLISSTNVTSISTLSVNGDVGEESSRVGQKTSVDGAVQMLRPESQLQRTQAYECPFHKIGSDDNLVKLLIAYIQTMLRKGHYPPFVHSKLYKCVEGDVLESLANAFCSLASHNASLPSSERFVHMMMNGERTRLVKAFVSRP